MITFKKKQNKKKKKKKNNRNVDKNMFFVLDRSAIVFILLIMSKCQQLLAF